MIESSRLFLLRTRLEGLAEHLPFSSLGTSSCKRTIDTLLLFTNMAVVLSPEESNYFSSSLLHRSHSQPKLIAYQASYLESPSKSKNSGRFNIILSPTNPASPSAPSPQSTLHANSTVPLYTSTHASWEDQDDEDQIVFPSYVPRQSNRRPRTSSEPSDR